MSSDQRWGLGGVLRQSSDAVSNRLGDGGVVVNLRTSRIFELNATGIRTWELIGDGLSTSDIERRLQEEFAVEPERVRGELQQLIADLAREGLVDVESGA